MRALLAATLVAGLLAGCLAPSDGSDSGAGAALDGEDAPSQRIGVVFFETDYEAMPQQDATFVAEVPEGARNVRFEVSRTPSVEPSGGFTVTVRGCGWAAPGSTTGVQAPGGWSGADLCASMPAGPAGVVVQSPMLPTSGRLLLRADLP